MSEDNRFFLEHIPQSDYRRIRYREGGPNYVNLHLDNLKHLSGLDKAAISEKIKILAESLAHVLLPPHLAEKECLNGYWKQVLSDLQVS